MQSIQKLQNMNYGIYAYNKNNHYCFFLFFFESLKTNRNCRMYFGISGVFCIINCHFEYDIQILCFFLYI